MSNASDISKAQRRTNNKSKAGKASSSDIQKNRQKLSKEEIELSNERKKKPQMKTSEIAEMVALWQSGEVTLKELAIRFNRDPASISRYMSVNGYNKGERAEEYAELLRQKVLEELSGDMMENVNRIKKVKEDYIRRFDTISRLVEKEISTALQNKVPMQNVLHNVRSLNEMCKVFQTARSETYALLQVVEFEQKVEKDDVPELHISELTSRDIEQMHIEQAKMAGISMGMPGVEEEAVDLSDEDFNDIIEEGDDE
jgi:hypothetical protein